MPAVKEIKLFCGNATPQLAQNVAQALGITLGGANVGRFSDGEVMVEILENVRGAEVFIIQSICHPINDSLMELVILADALRRASVDKITAIIPYFGYSRQDRRTRSARVPISSRVIADMLASVGITRMITVDLHAEQIQGFFSMPVDNIYASTVLLNDLDLVGNIDYTVVSPDIGGVMRARAVAKRLNDADLAIIDKRRPEKNKSQVMNVIGEVKGKHCIIIDDIVDTGGTLIQAAEALKEQGALIVSAYCTHPVLSGNAIEEISKSCLDRLIVTDSIPLLNKPFACEKIRQLGLSEMLAETIRRVSRRDSLSSMFLD